MDRERGLHRGASPPARRRRGEKGAAPAAAAAREALGRSRGGLSTKVHLACDERGRPLSVVLTPGQSGDAPRFDEVMAGVRCRTRSGRVRTRPDRVLADRAYDSRAIRGHLRRRGITATIPQAADRVRNRLAKGSRGGRPPAFDPNAYKQRNTVERCINRLKQWRGLATRYDKTAHSYMAALTIASLMIWLATK
ncbi:IS5 family transposase [Saccharothrix sp. NPDC042600]|uniref:IS5 family transposase n=1 Tax=Saccharothrix sp. NPDC042600 TaxID=3154492 RepID=UPI0033F7A263